jgi:hypothetical protein
MHCAVVALSVLRRRHTKCGADGDEASAALELALKPALKLALKPARGARQAASG